MIFFLTEIVNKYIIKIRRNNIFILPSPAIETLAFLMGRGDRGAGDEEMLFAQAEAIKRKWNVAVPFIILHRKQKQNFSLLSG